MWPNSPTHLYDWTARWQTWVRKHPRCYVELDATRHFNATHAYVKAVSDELPPWSQWGEWLQGRVYRGVLMASPLRGGENRMFVIEPGTGLLRAMSDAMLVDPEAFPWIGVDGVPDTIHRIADDDARQTAYTAYVSSL